MLGSMGILDSYGAALELLARGLVETAPLLTHAFPLEQFPERRWTYRAPAAE